ncbi:Mth938-like domain-containing protein [Caedibacter taeniospiralis]|uniref:Mth938-like domain-containing protein n=1 Tax=Caedibacter taeniospiralis TaxID=28907 RepID=UPI000C272538|nr:Mth938-like domain-containing protein [Caedibacter taeniospiralis]
MQLAHEKPDTVIYVKHYQHGQLTLPQKILHNSVIITPEMILQENWGVRDIDKLDVHELSGFIGFDANIYLLGTGRTIQIPKDEIIIAFARLGKSLDFMDSAAACRTFNILANEGRNVVAAIIV